MDEILLYLCPNQNLEDIKQHSDLVKTYLNDSNRLFNESLCVEEIKIEEPKCFMCGNTDENNMYQDDCSGDLICLGVDNYGCGNVIADRPLRCCSTSDISMDPMYSSQYNFQSYFSDNPGLLNKTNNLVERKYLKEYDNVTTSECYKNDQRTKVYDTLENIKVVCNIDNDIVDRVKIMFNEYRNKMTRIHKLNMVLASLFYLNLNGGFPTVR